MNWLQYKKKCDIIQILIDNTYLCVFVIDTVKNHDAGRGFAWKGYFMEIRVLQYFLMVANEGNFTRAAERLHLSQPTLSRQLSDLEKEYGTQLFIREPRHVRLTEEGLLLKRRAEEILALVDETEQDLLQRQDEISGDIHIGAGESVYFQAILEIIRELRQVHPGIHVHVVTGDAESCQYALDKGLIDFTFAYGDWDPVRYEMLPLPFKDQWGLVLRKDDELASCREITPEQIWSRDLILSRQAVSDSTHGDAVKAWLRKPLEDLKVAGTYTMAYNGSLMVRAGMGVMLTFKHLVNLEGTGLLWRNIRPAVYAEPRLVWKKRQIFSKASKLFLEKLQKKFC